MSICQLFYVNKFLKIKKKASVSSPPKTIPPQKEATEALWKLYKRGPCCGIHIEQILRAISDFLIRWTDATWTWIWFSYKKTCVPYTHYVYVSYGTVADLLSIELGKPFKQMWTLGSVKVPSWEADRGWTVSPTPPTLQVSLPWFPTLPFTHPQRQLRTF